jgi:hypothetical protein
VGLVFFGYLEALLFLDQNFYFLESWTANTHRRHFIMFQSTSKTSHPALNNDFAGLPQIVEWTKLALSPNGLIQVPI